MGVAGGRFKFETSKLKLRLNRRGGAIIFPQVV